MTLNSTNITPKGFVIRLCDSVHVAGECCQHWICSWCGNRKHTQAIVTDSVVVGVEEACESCDIDKFWEPVNGAKRS